MPLTRASGWACVPLAISIACSSSTATSGTPAPDTKDLVCSGAPVTCHGADDPMHPHSGCDTQTFIDDGHPGACGAPKATLSGTQPPGAACTDNGDSTQCQAYCCICPQNTKRAGLAVLTSACQDGKCVSVADTCCLDVLLERCSQ